MVVDTGIILAGTGYAGSAIARELARDHADNAPYVLVDKTAGEMLLDVILSDEGVVAGALIARGGQVEAMRAPVVVLATGGAAGLFSDGDWRHSGDGLAVAHRAGVALAKPHVTDHDGRRELRAGIPCKADGATSLSGLYVAGSLGADRPDPAKVARAAIVRSREGPEPLGPYKQQPAIDSPLPDGFAEVKFDRLRAITSRVLDGELPLDRALVELHRLKGEADEFARARVDLQLFSLQNACEVAILLLKAA